MSTPTLLETWHALVQHAPDAPAVIEAASGRTWSRRALQDRAVELTHDLRASAQTPGLGGDARPGGVGIVSGQRVTFALPNGAEWLARFLALLACDAVPVPLDPGESRDAQLALTRAAGVTLAWLGDRPEIVPPAAAADTRKASTRTRRATNAGASKSALCLVKLTSGSTGTPKALAFTHAEMLADGRQVCASMDIRPGDLNLAAIPLGHSYGLGNFVVPLLAQGTALLCPSAPLPQVLAAEIARWRPTVFPAVPALIRALASAAIPAEALASLRTVISAGASLPAETAQAFAEKFGRRVHGFYGSSETGGITYDRDGEATLTGRSVGVPLEGVTLTFGRGGRFTVASAAVISQGSRTPGRHRPSDRAVLNTSGELVLQGRVGRMVKVAGRRLELADLEATLRSVPGVRDAFVAPHPTRPEELAAVLATALPLAEARATLAARVAAWKLPRRLLTVPEFPLTPRGKVDTRALAALLAKER